MVMQWFIRLVSGTVNASQETVRALGDILSGPVPFLGFRESISFLTYPTSTWRKENCRRLHLRLILLTLRKQKHVQTK